jgi:hypothetical protein
MVVTNSLPMDISRRCELATLLAQVRLSINRPKAMHGRRYFTRTNFMILPETFQSCT